MLSNLGTGEVVIIAIIVLIFFGSKKLKELARGLGEASAEVKKITKEIETGGDG